MSFIIGAIRSNTGSIAISALLGLGLSSLFRTVCDNCVVVRAVHPQDAVSTIWTTDDESGCVAYESEPAECTAWSLQCMHEPHGDIARAARAPMHA